MRQHLSPRQTLIRCKRSFHTPNLAIAEAPSSKREPITAVSKRSGLSTKLSKICPTKKPARWMLEALSRPSMPTSTGIASESSIRSGQPCVSKPHYSILRQVVKDVAASARGSPVSRASTPSVETVAYVPSLSAYVLSPPDVSVARKEFTARGTLLDAESQEDDLFEHMSSLTTLHRKEYTARSNLLPVLPISSFTHVTSLSPSLGPSVPLSTLDPALAVQEMFETSVIKRAKRLRNLFAQNDDWWPFMATAAQQELAHHIRWHASGPVYSAKVKKLLPRNRRDHDQLMSGALLRRRLWEESLLWEEDYDLFDPYGARSSKFIRPSVPKRLRSRQKKWPKIQPLPQAIMQTRQFENSFDTDSALFTPGIHSLRRSSSRQGPTLIVASLDNEPLFDGPWKEEEKRIAEDGIAYTRRGFIKHYRAAWQSKWDAAKVAPAVSTSLQASDSVEEEDSPPLAILDAGMEFDEDGEETKVATLRAELEQERARTQQLHAQLQAAPRAPSRQQSQHGSHSQRDLEVLQARAQELERELMEVRNGGGAASAGASGAHCSAEMLSVATPTRSRSSSVHGAHRPSASQGFRESSQHGLRDFSQHGGGTSHPAWQGMREPSQQGFREPSQHGPREFSQHSGVPHPPWQSMREPSQQGFRDPSQHGLREFSQQGAAPPLPFGSPGAPPTFRSDPLDAHESPGGPRRAVIVGCDYSGQMGTLRAGVSDARQWARFFMKRCGMSERDIRLLSDDPAHYQQRDQPDTVVATRENILRSLRWLTARCAMGDQIFFVFCGLGVQVVAEEFAGQRLCENGIAPTDVLADRDQPRVVSDTDVHKALQTVPSGVQATLIYDCCHAGQPLDRAGLNFLTEHVNRGVVDYEKLRGHPVLPRFLEMQQWKVRPNPPEAVRESNLSCQAVQWAACSNEQFCVELPIDDRPRGVFSYIFVNVLMNQADLHAGSDVLLREMQALTSQLKGRWRLQQDVRLTLSHSSGGVLPFLR